MKNDLDYTDMIKKEKYIAYIGQSQKSVYSFHGVSRKRRVIEKLVNTKENVSFRVNRRIIIDFCLFRKLGAPDSKDLPL
jgi:hypothetical protein